MSKKFASAGDMAEKKISFTEIGRDIWALLMRSKAADLPHDMPQEPE